MAFGYKKSISLPSGTGGVPVVASTNGAACDVSDIVSMQFAITGVGTGTYQVQVSYDGTNFVNLGSAFTADGTLAVPDAVKQVRVRCTAYTSGTPVGAVAGVLPSA